MVAIPQLLLSPHRTVPCSSAREGGKGLSDYETGVQSRWTWRVKPEERRSAKLCSNGQEREKEQWGERYNKSEFRFPM